MRKKIFLGAAVMAVAGVLLVWTALASEKLTEKQWSLTEIKELFVFVQGVTEETKKVGLSVERIQTDVEEKLKELGIKIVTEEEAEKPSDKPTLYVTINARKRERVAAFMFHVDVGILQKVSLVREPQIRIMSITWRNGRIGECHSRRLMKSVLESVKYLMDRFCEDYRKANPPIEAEG